MSTSRIYLKPRGIGFQPVLACFDRLEAYPTSTKTRISSKFMYCRTGGTVFAKDLPTRKKVHFSTFGRKQMSDTKEISAAEAIRQIIAETGSVDYIDVVNAVHKRFRLGVTAAEVEQVYHDLANETKSKPQARTSVTLTSMTADPSPPEPGKPASRQAESNLTGPAPVPSSALPKDELGQALQFVKSVGGLANAKRILKELEAALLGSD
jgi:hypothetical protein